jgi:hypothetical protein
MLIRESSGEIVLLNCSSRRSAAVVDSIHIQQKKPLSKFNKKREQKKGSKKEVTENGRTERGIGAAADRSAGGGGRPLLFFAA